MSYDTWKTTDPKDNPRLDAIYEHHNETCEYCLYLEVYHRRKDSDCADCGHFFHGSYQCEQNEDGSTFRCECTGPGTLSDAIVRDLQDACWHDWLRDQAERAADANYDARRDE